MIIKTKNNTYRIDEFYPWKLWNMTDEERRKTPTVLFQITKTEESQKEEFKDEEYFTKEGPIPIAKGTSVAADQIFLQNEKFIALMGGVVQIKEDLADPFKGYPNKGDEKKSF